ncbi:MAG: PDZ domain-containing protein, partial [Nitrospinae bacterium]|nr:PDZ domain-containing protein [Nitrospinota bacterium]
MGGEINDDPALVQLLFAMPPDVMEEVETPVRPPRQPKGWLGVTLQEGPPLFLKGADDLAPTLEVLKVFPHSSAERAGLLPGDIILATHGEQLSIGEENSLMMNFNRRVQDTGAGDILRLKIKRGGREMELPVELFPKPTTPVFIKPPRLEAPDLPDSLLYRILRSKNRLEDYAATVEEMRERTTEAVTTAVKGKTYNPFRLQEVNTVLNQPMDLPLVAYGLTSTLRRNFIGGWLNSGGVIRWALQELDFKVAEKVPGKKPADLQQLLDRLLAALARAGRLREEALAPLTSDEKDLLYRGIRHLMVDSLQPRDLTDEAALKNAPDISDFLNTALKVDMQKLLSASFNIARAIDLEMLLEWKDNLDQFSLFHEGWIIEPKGDITYVYTRHGLMIVGGTGDNVYEQDALLIVDLGGNDRYLNGAGASRIGHPFSMVIDFSGDDVYLSGAGHAQGAGILGGGLLIGGSLALAADLSPHEQLVARGLSKKASYYLLPSEIDFNKRLPDARKTRGKLSEALKKQAGFEERKQQHRKNIREYVAERMRLANRLAGTGDVAKQNRLIARLNFLNEQIELYTAGGVFHDE